MSRLLDLARGLFAVGAAEPAPPATRPATAVQAYTSWDMTDPRVIDFMREGWSSSTGVSMNAPVALRNSTFFRALSLIAGAVGMLPLHLMEQDEDGGNKRKARKHPLFAVLHRRPNRYQTVLEFKSFLQGTALMDGSAYGLVIRTGKKIVGIAPMRRRSVTPRMTSDNLDIEFVYQRPTGGSVTLPSRDVFHFRHPLTLDGLRGVSLLQMAADTLGIASVAQRAVGRLFRNGSFAQGTLETDKTLGDDAHRRISEDWAELYSGSDSAGKWPILEEGLKAKPLVAAKDAELIATRQHEAEEIARFTGAPRPLLMFDETSWGSGIEQLGQMFVTYCLMPWFVSWEQAIERILEPEEQGLLYAKFNAGALLRGTPKDQAEFFAKALGSGGSAAWMTPDEVRDNFEMNPTAGGDVLPARTSSGSGSTEPAPANPPPPKR
jgi:HK97 family phage portal protein